MADPEKMLNDEEFFADTVDIPKEGVEQHRKRECLKGAISKALGGKKQWTHEKVGKASEETINKTYAVHKKRELNEKGEETGKA